jgi:CheY-like chemotaxis protein
MAENRKEGVEKVRKHRPNIIFMYMRMLVMRGEEATKLIQDEYGKD